MSSGTLKYVIAVLSILCVNCHRQSNGSSGLSRAFENLLQSFGASNREILIESFRRDSIIIDQLVLNWCKSQTFPYKVTKLEANLDSDGFELSESAILLFYSVDSLRAFNSKVRLTNRFPKQFQFIVHCEFASLDEIAALSDTQILQFQYFVIEDDQFIKLMTFVWYTSEQCRVPQLVEVNKFQKNISRWESRKFVTKKFTNFHGCHLFVAVQQNNPAEFFTLHKSYATYSGYDMKALYEMEENLNVTVRGNALLEDTKKPLHEDRPIDFQLRSERFPLYLEKEIFMTRAYKSWSDFIVVSPPESYSEYEKLLLPFDIGSWILIIATFAIAILTVFLISFAKPEVRNFVFGSNVTTPGFNIVMIFFGLSQMKLPGRNFARFLVVVFVVYCLIIRTVWQGKTFEFMNRDMTKPDVTSIDEFIERNFTLYIRKSFFDVMANLELSRR